MALRHLRFPALRAPVPTRHPRFAPLRCPAQRAPPLPGCAQAFALHSPAPSRRLGAGYRSLQKTPGVPPAATPQAPAAPAVPPRLRRVSQTRMKTISTVIAWNRYSPLRGLSAPPTPLRLTPLQPLASSRPAGGWPPHPVRSTSPTRISLFRPPRSPPHRRWGGSRVGLLPAPRTCWYGGAPKKPYDASPLRGFAHHTSNKTPPPERRHALQASAVAITQSSNIPPGALNFKAPVAVRSLS